MNIESLLTNLSARLPELRWKLSQLGPSFRVSSLPKGLFRLNTAIEPQAYVQEIQQDILTLAQREDYQCSVFIAEKISQKINVLVSLCHQYRPINKVKTTPAFTVDRLISRQQWLDSLAKEISLLEEQQQALLQTLTAMDSQIGQATLNLKAELGTLERQLSLAREAYQKKCFLPHNVNSVV